MISYQPGRVHRFPVTSGGAQGRAVSTAPGGHRTGGTDPTLERALLTTVNGIAAGMRNTG